jgi:hypothetical protein
MKMFAQLVGAGLVGILTLKVLGWIALPVLGLATGFFAFMLKVAVVLVVGWLVLRLFRGKRETVV